MFGRAKPDPLGGEQRLLTVKVRAIQDPDNGPALPPCGHLALTFGRLAYIHYAGVQSWPWSAVTGPQELFPGTAIMRVDGGPWWWVTLEKARDVTAFVVTASRVRELRASVSL